MMLSNLNELWRYRSLVAALVSRNLAARYRGSFLGFLWSMLNPLFFMLVYTLVFRFYIRFSEVENYSLFLFCGLLPWIWFSSGITEGTNSIVHSGHLITKSMFPPQILPVVTGLATLVNFVLSLPLLFLFMWAAGAEVPTTAVLLPLLVAVQLFLILGLSLLLSALNVHFRDVQHLLSNVLTLLFFLCPIIYPATVVPQEFRFTMLWNPLALLTSFYHMTLLEGVLPSLAAMVYLLCFTAAVFLAGNMVFNRYREEFAELL